MHYCVRGAASLALFSGSMLGCSGADVGAPGEPDVESTLEAEMPLDTATVARFCREATTLRALVSCISSKMPRAGSNGYVVPTAAQQADWSSVVSRMLSGRCDFALPTSLSGNMGLRSFTDAEDGRVYCVLLEAADVDGNGYVDKGWGTFIVNPRAARELSQQAPHPGADAGTELQAIDVFKATASRSFLMCGAHRAANAAASACEPAYGVADCAHATSSMFYTTSRALNESYGSSVVAQVQWHGMSATTCPHVDAHISEGVPFAPAATSGVARLRGKVARDNPTWSVTDASTWMCTLDATDNVEARYLNTADPSAACGSSPTPASGKFVSIEQTPGVRSAAPWVRAIVDTWPR